MVGNENDEFSSDKDQFIIYDLNEKLMSRGI